MLFYVYYAAILMLLLAGVKFAGIKDWNQEFLSLEESKAIQAICAILIVFHHLSQKLEYCKEIQIFKEAGILFVGIFLFCSGYGLVKSMERKENYLDHFLKKRLLTVLIPFYMINSIYVIYNIMEGMYIGLSDSQKVKEIALGLAGIKLGSGNEWFIITITFLYIVFYVLFKYCKEAVAFSLMLLIILIYCGAGIYIDHGDLWLQGEWWYNTTLMFFVGLIFAKFERQILTWTKKLYYLLLPVMLVAFYFVYHYSIKVLYEHSYWCEYNGGITRKEIIVNRLMSFGVQNVAVLLFAVVVLLVMLKFHFQNPVLSAFGKISLELYLIHDLFIMFFQSRHCAIYEDINYVSAVLGASLVAAAALEFLSSRIVNAVIKKS